MRVGTMFLGKVDTLDNESIQTKFFVLGVPLLPVESYYVLAEDASGVRGLEIPLSSKSVTFGYVRIFSWLGALLFGVFGYVESRDAGTLWSLGALTLAVGIVSTFFMGGLSEREKMRRTFLKLLTGVGAPPDLLPRALVDKTRTKLVDAWKEEHDERAWEEAIGRGEAEPLLFALAEYHERADLAAEVLERMTKPDRDATAGPYRTGPRR